MGPVTRGEAYAHIKAVTQNKQRSEAAKFEKQSAAADKKNKKTADMIAGGADAELQERLAGLVDAGGLDVEKIAKEFKAGQMKSLIAFRGGVPKGPLKADFAQQLFKMLNSGPAPLLLTAS